MELIVDRFEGDFAVCEQADRRMVSIPRSALPPGCRAGSLLVRTESGYALADDTKRRKRIEEKLRALLK